MTTASSSVPKIADLAEYIHNAEFLTSSPKKINNAEIDKQEVHGLLLHWGSKHSVFLLIDSNEDQGKNAET